MWPSVSWITSYLVASEKIEHISVGLPGLLASVVLGPGKYGKYGRSRADGIYRAHYTHNTSHEHHPSIEASTLHSHTQHPPHISAGSTCHISAAVVICQLISPVRIYFAAPVLEKEVIEKSPI